MAVRVAGNIKVGVAGFGKLIQWSGRRQIITDKKLQWMNGVERKLQLSLDGRLSEDNHALVTT